MSRKSIPGSLTMATAIKTRRIELKLTIEEAAKRANVGTKTWCRYEAGESIRQDKCKGVCKALNWRSLPSLEQDDSTSINVAEYRKDKYWSKALEKNFGETAAMSFIIGSEILGDYINMDLRELAKMPKGSHLGELPLSMLLSDLPEQFLTRYDYDFLYALKCSLLRLKACLLHNQELVAHSVMEELALFLIIEESRILLEEGDYTPETGWDEWIFDIFGDMDIVTMLYSDHFVTEDSTYYFDFWMKDQFFTT